MINEQKTWDVPVGTIVPFISSTIPNNWLPCDGSPVPEEYTDLKDGLNISNTPNLSGRSIIGTGKSTHNEYNYKLKDIGGSEVHKLTKEEMPKHNHLLRCQVTASGTGESEWCKIFNAANGDEPHSDSITSEGGDKEHNNMMPYMALRFIIYAGPIRME